MLYLNYSKNSTKRLAMRKFEFQNENYYHIFNRGVDKRNIFSDKNDYIRFIRSMREFNQLEPVGSLYLKEKTSLASGSTAFEAVEPLVDIITYCLLPNHYHFLLKQLIDNGISEFIKRLAGGYTWYFNNKYNRSGSLFQGTFKAVEIKSDRQLQQVSCYINGNPKIHNICKAKNWPWSSYLDYLNLRKGNLCRKNIIFEQFKNTKEYEELTNKIIIDSKQQKNELKILLA